MRSSPPAANLRGRLAAMFLPQLLQPINYGLDSVKAVVAKAPGALRGRWGYGDVGAREGGSEGRAPARAHLAQRQLAKAGGLSKAHAERQQSRATE